jgi:hypothetical protein
MGAPLNMPPSWAALISYNGTVITRFTSTSWKSKPKPSDYEASTQNNNDIREALNACRPHPLPNGMPARECG